MLELPLTFSQRAAAPGTPRPWLLVLLHDVASNEHTLLQQVTAFPERFYLLSLRAPNRMGPGSHSWFDFSIPPGGNPVINLEQEAGSRALVVQSIVAAGLQLGIAPEHVVVILPARYGRSVCAWTSADVTRSRLARRVFMILAGKRLDF